MHLLHELLQLGSTYESKLPDWVFGHSKSITDLLNCKVRLEIRGNDVVAGLLRLSIYRVRCDQTYPAQHCVDVGEILRVLQRIAKGIRGQTGRFSNELAIDRLAPLKFLVGALPLFLDLLRHPGGSD